VTVPRPHGGPPLGPGVGVQDTPRGKRWVLLVVGWVFFALGAAGTVLPLLLASPLFLVALWAFSSSSERFHRWLSDHRVFGPTLQAWRRDSRPRAAPRGAAEHRPTR